MVTPREIKLTTTQTITIDDLNGRTFTHPTVDFDLLSEFSVNKISKSSDVQAAIVAGYIELRDEDGVFINALEVINVLHNLYATTNPTVDDDTDAGYSKGSYWMNYSESAIWFCSDNAIGAAVWKRLITSGGQVSGVPSFSGSFFTSSNPYLEYNSTSWQAAMQFPYEGSSVIEISKVVIIGSRNGASGIAYFRLYDITHNLEIYGYFQLAF